MESKLFDEIEGKELKITMFQTSSPINCKLISQDENFIKVEKISKKANHETMIFNKSLISTIIIK